MIISEFLSSEGHFF